MPASNQNLNQVTNALIQNFQQSNPNLRRARNNARANVGGRNGVVAILTNVGSNGEREIIELSATKLSDGSTLFMIGVAPEAEYNAYQSTFNRVRSGLSINDR